MFLLKYLLPFLLPALLFVLWVWLTRRDEGRFGERIANGPWFWLIIGGVVCAAVVLSVTALTTGGEPGSTIVPPRYEDGRVVPAEIKER